jgi:hypothetical protein
MSNLNNVYDSLKMKIKRVNHVFFLWLDYLFKSRYKIESLLDFKVWLQTTFLKKDTLSVDALPWISLPALRWLTGYIKPEMSVFEWGSGASTVFFSRRVSKLVSVEHDDQWFKKIKLKISDDCTCDVTLRNVGCDSISNATLMDEMELDLYKTSVPSFAGSCFYNYVRSILDYPDGAFDIILVDGRARTGCLGLAKTKVRRGGVVILDDSERRHYGPGIALFNSSQWEVFNFDGPATNSKWPVFWRTTVFLKR